VDSIELLCGGDGADVVGRVRTRDESGWEDWGPCGVVLYHAAVDQL
jgi:hypothetical protein